eukprot:1160634-Amphidinium_carterae.1
MGADRVMPEHDPVLTLFLPDWLRMRHDSWEISSNARCSHLGSVVDEHSGMNLKKVSSLLMISFPDQE